MTLVRVVKNSDDSNKKLNYEEETLHEHKKKAYGPVVVNAVCLI